MSDQRFSAIPNDAVFDKRLTSMDIRVLAALGTFTDKKGWCYPKQKTIAERIETSRPNVNASINRLVEHGYVEKQQRIGESGGKISCKYRVKLDLAEQEARDVSRADIGKDSMSADDTSKSAGGTSSSAGQTSDVSQVDNKELEPPELDKAPPTEEPKPPPHSMREDWWPSAKTIAYARKLGFADWEIEAAATECRDYWLDNPKTKRPGWDNTLKKRLRDLKEDPIARRKLKHVLPDAPQTKTISEPERRRRLQEFEDYGTWDARWGPKPSAEARAA